MLTALKNAISPFDEVVAYETLWATHGFNWQKMATLFKDDNDIPSKVLHNHVSIFDLEDMFSKVQQYMESKKGYSVCIKGDYQYPDNLLAAKCPLELFYYKGDIELLKTKNVSVVGTRKPTSYGQKMTLAVTKELVKNDHTIVSGLAAGIDTIALNKAISEKGRVVGVIGTPIDSYYPKENKTLQDRIAANFLLMSQVPFYRYNKEPFKNRPYYFPERNKTMSAVSEATVIIEASETSGTRTQATACIDQGRKLFLSRLIVEDKKLSWPKNFINKGAIVFDKPSDILSKLCQK